MSDERLDAIEDAYVQLVDLNRQLRAMPPELALAEQYESIHALMGAIFTAGTLHSEGEARAPYALTGKRLRSVLHLLDHYLTSWEAKIPSAELQSLFFVRSSFEFCRTLFAGTEITADDAWSAEEFEDFDEELQDRLSASMAFNGKVPEGVPESHWWWFA